MTAKDWNLKMVQAEAALALLAKNAATGHVDWGEIDVAHIDTGCTRHPVFGFNAAGVSDFIQLEAGVNHMELGSLPIDPLDYTGFPGHGTRIASVLCGSLPGTHMGVAPHLPVIPYRAVNSVLLASKKSRNRVGAAIKHAVNENGCEVISISLGYPMMSLFSKRRLGLAVDNAYENGVIITAAGGQVIDRVTYPGKFSRTIGVGGIRPDAEVWHQYDVSESVIRSIDIWAPGDDIHRANSILQNGETVPAEYKHGDGTSYATAHVAAAAAMWLTYHGEEKLDDKYPEPWKRVEAFRKVVHDTGKDIKGSYWPNRDRGILQIEKLLRAELPDVTDEDKRPPAEGEIF